MRIHPVVWGTLAGVDRSQLPGGSTGRRAVGRHTDELSQPRGGKPRVLLEPFPLQTELAYDSGWCQLEGGLRTPAHSSRPSSPGLTQSSGMDHQQHEWRLCDLRPARRVVKRARRARLHSTQLPDEARLKESGGGFVATPLGDLTGSAGSGGSMTWRPWAAPRMRLARATARPSLAPQRVRAD